MIYQPELRNSGQCIGMSQAEHYTVYSEHGDLLKMMPMFFVQKEQLQEEVGRLIDLTFDVYHHFGFHNISVALSTRPEKGWGVTCFGISLKTRCGKH